MNRKQLLAQINSSAGECTLDIVPPAFLGLAALTITGAEIIPGTGPLRIRGIAAGMSVDASFTGVANLRSQCTLTNVPALEAIRFAGLPLRARKLHYDSKPRPAWRLEAELPLGAAVVPVRADAVSPLCNLHLASPVAVNLPGLDPLFGEYHWRDWLPEAQFWQLTELLIAYLPGQDRIEGLSCTLSATAPVPVDGLGLAASIREFQAGFTASPEVYATASGQLQLGSFCFNAALDAATMRLSASAEKRTVDWVALQDSGVLQGLTLLERARPGARFTDVYLDMTCTAHMGGYRAELVSAAATNARGQEESWERR